MAENVTRTQAASNVSERPLPSPIALDTLAVSLRSALELPSPRPAEWPALRAEDVSFAVPGRKLVDGISLALRPGELTGIVGVNGAGKSTLLRLLAGDLTPAAGCVLLDGRALPAWERAERARRLAVLPQELQLHFPLTAAEVALLGRAPHGTGGRETATDHHAARSALLLTGAAHLAGRTYPTLSGGEKQRVQLARVLAQLWHGEDEVTPPPRYLLLDEPTASLDLAHQLAVLRVVREFTRRGVGAVAVLHDLNAAARFCDRLALLHDGRLLAEGSPGEVLTAARVREAFHLEAHVAPHPTLGCPVITPL